MSTRARGRTNATQRGTSPPAATLAPTVPPERLLLDAIADGELDHGLHALADAVAARLHLLHTVESATALAQLTVGDRVRINHTVTPRYLHGAAGRIVDLDSHTASVCLDRPVGRFTSGQVRCPPLALDRIPRSA